MNHPYWIRRPLLSVVVAARRQAVVVSSSPTASFWLRRVGRKRPWSGLTGGTDGDTTTTTTETSGATTGSPTETVRDAPSSSSSSSQTLPRFFDDLNLHSILQTGLAKGATHSQEPYQQLTPIQAQAWHPVVQGNDVVALARTGTGKTLAFLLPSLQRLLVELESSTADASSPTVARENDKNNHELSPSVLPSVLLVIAPTRELAQQSAFVARQLVGHKGGLVAAWHGGISKKRDLAQLHKLLRTTQPPSSPIVLVTTPGRLLDHMESTTTLTIDGDDNNPEENELLHLYQNMSFPQFIWQTTRILVLDEMDTLLNMGFRNTIRRILTYLPVERQTLLVSATTSSDIEAMMRKCVQNDPHRVVTIDCLTQVENHDGTPHHHLTIPQSYVVVPTNDIVWRIVQIVVYLARSSHCKAVVFFPTTAQVRFFACLVQRGLGIGQILEMHGQLSQGRRSVVSERFRTLSNGVLLSTDVSARGMDYPNVTHVVQIGIPSNVDTYIHRLGRTGRVGGQQEGQGVILLTPAERPFLDQDLADQEVVEHITWQGLVERRIFPDLEEAREELVHRVRTGQWPELVDLANQMYEALLGYYSSQLRRYSSSSRKNDTKWQDQVIDAAIEYCQQAGLAEAPFLSRSTAAQLGLEDNPRVVLRERWSSGRTFDVGVSSEADDDGTVWPKDLERPRRSLQRDRLTNTSGLWDDEFES